MSQRVELCQCPGCGREKPIAAEMAQLATVCVIVIETWSLVGACRICGLKPGEPESPPTADMNPRNPRLHGANTGMGRSPKKRQTVPPKPGEPDG